MDSIKNKTRGSLAINSSNLIIKSLLVSLLLIFPPIIYASSNSTTKKLITINQFVSHTALDAATSGIKEALHERGILPNKAELQIANAKGNITNSVQIAKHQASLSPDFMIGIATPSAQANLKARVNDNTILGFVAVTDPQSAGIAEAPNTIGVNDKPPIEELIEITLQVFPNLKTVGSVFNPGEINSTQMLKTLEKILAKKNITLKKSALHSSNEVKMALQKLIGKVDLIYLPQDNTVVSGIDSIAREAIKAKLPVIANDPSLVDKGLLLALGCDYLNSGRQLGFMIADIIDGHKVAPTIQMSNIKELKINYQVAKQLGITIPSNAELVSGSPEYLTRP